MKKLALISAVLFTTLTFHSCRQSDDILSPEEAQTLQRVRDSADHSLNKSNIKILNSDQSAPENLEVDGELLPPPRK